MSSCIGCKCNICTYNVNLDLQYFTPGEVDSVCFNCDDCMATEYGGRWKGECDQYRKPAKKLDMEMRIARSKLKLLRGESMKHIIMLPARANVPNPGHKDWKLVKCPVCGAECWESDLTRETKRLFPEMPAICTPCALRAAPPPRWNSNE